MPKNPIQTLIDSGLQFTDMQRKEAEKLVKQLVRTGEVRRADAEKSVQSLIEQGKETSAQIAECDQERGHQAARMAGQSCRRSPSCSRWLK